MEKLTFRKGSIWIKFLVGSSIVCIGIVVYILMNSYLVTLPKFQTDDQSSWSIAALLSKDQSVEYALVKPSDNGITFSQATKQVLTDKYASFVRPCSFASRIVCIVSKTGKTDSSQKIIYQWQIQKDVVESIGKLPDDRDQIGINAQGIYQIGRTSPKNYNTIYRVSFTGQENVVAQIDRNLYCKQKASPNGVYIAFACTGWAMAGPGIQVNKNGTRIFLLDTTNNILLQLTDPGYIRSVNGVSSELELAWSPDSTQIAFLRSNAPPNPNSWLGKMGVYDNPVSIYSANIQDGSLYEWTELDQSNGLFMSWSPDNNYIIYSTMINKVQLHITSKHQRIRSLGSPQNKIKRLDWAPDGSNIALLDGSSTLWIASTSDYTWHILLESVKDFVWVNTQ